ncbi:hypothetical protein EJ02DRAFT_418859 [Clathrospora elynae]|uniref:Uncharacterized protein n=1 Tax=Clathrospora elynae TaxID=706981 RepID=A0A6A5T242_9PLEO|nr:hypothetical protein EJ02DRAFT_418859 [Clathrospora elynae]
MSTTFTSTFVFTNKNETYSPPSLLSLALQGEHLKHVNAPPPTPPPTPPPSPPPPPNASISIPTPEIAQHLHNRALASDFDKNWEPTSARVHHHLDTIADYYSTSSAGSQKAFGREEVHKKEECEEKEGLEEGVEEEGNDDKGKGKDVVERDWQECTGKDERIMRRWEIVIGMLRRR